MSSIFDVSFSISFVLIFSSFLVVISSLAKDSPFGVYKNTKKIFSTRIESVVID